MINLFRYLSSTERAFKRAFAALNDALSRSGRQRSTEIARERQQNALSLPSDTAIPAISRFELHRRHAELAGEDFLALVRSMVFSTCSRISDNNRSQLKGKLKQLTDSVARRCSEIERDIAPTDPMHATAMKHAESEVGLAFLKYQNQLETDIAEHNLKVRVSRERKRNDQLGNLLWRILSAIIGAVIGWIAKSMTSGN